MTDVVQNTTSSRKRKSAAPQYIPVSHQPQLCTPTKSASPSSQDYSSSCNPLSSKNSHDTIVTHDDTWPDADTAAYIDPPALTERENYPKIRSRSKVISSLAAHDNEVYNSAATQFASAISHDLDGASTSGICGSDVPLCGPFITNSVALPHQVGNSSNGSNLLNTSAESSTSTAAVDPASLISIQADQLTQSSHIDLSSVLDQAASGELPLVDFNSMAGLVGQPVGQPLVGGVEGLPGVSGLNAAAVWPPVKRGRGRGRKNRGKTAIIIRIWRKRTVEFIHGVSLPTQVPIGCDLNAVFQHLSHSL